MKMSNVFDILNNYKLDCSNKKYNRRISVQAALILINSSLSSPTQSVMKTTVLEHLDDDYILTLAKQIEFALKVDD